MTHTPYSLRQRFVTGPLLKWVRGVLPTMSDTEREALEAGNTWWDAELFSGKPDWQKLLDMGPPELTDEEKAFLDGPTEELCRRLDDWQINFELRRLPEEIWDFIKSNGFLGMIIPKKYGGLGFSASAHAAVITKLSSRSIAAAVTVMVPNSLGPGELLLEYGTEEQKDFYLPRLASGQDIPCFGLTSTEAGSDAAAMIDRGVVCHATVEGKKTLGMRVNWSKRYITLGPVATLLGLAFKLSDPDHILGDTEELGITVALVPTDTEGVEIGRRHLPAMQAFQNGPNSGTDVFIPMEWVIGGQDRVGQGWKMLVSALAAGRGISLPSLSNSGTKAAARATGAYARIRRQFGIPVGQFEGVQEVLARIAGQTYTIDAACRATSRALDCGEKPAVITAIMKAQATDRLRNVVNDAMDIHGGKGICDGPRNYLGNAYRAIPIGITVEGANILTRSLMIYGQGAIRCHPFLLTEMMAAQNSDKAEGLVQFDKAIFGHLRFQVSTFARSLFHSITGARFAASPVDGPTEIYFREASRASASFALISEAALVILGGELKRREMLSGRLADILSELYFMSCVLKRFEDEGRPAGDLPLVHWSCQTSLYTIQERMDQVLDNFPSRLAAWALRATTFTFGFYRDLPSDDLTRECAELLLAPSPTRDRLTGGIFIGSAGDSLAMLDRALVDVVALEPVERRMRKAGFRNVDDANSAGIITIEEAQQLRDTESLIREILTVDDYDPSEIVPDMSSDLNSLDRNAPKTDKAGTGTDGTGEEPSQGNQPKKRTRKPATAPST